MTAIRYLVGDATTPIGEGPKIIAHVCNDRGGWGAGFVLAISRRWPEPEAAYREWHDARESSGFALGVVQLVAVGDEVSVANMVAQRGFQHTAEGPPLRYDALEQCLAELARIAADAGATVHMPRIGCGLAGGEWAMIGPLIEKTLGTAGVEVTVYDLGA